MSAWGRFRGWRWWWQALVWACVPPVPVGLWAASQPRPGRRLAWGLVALVAAAWLSVAWATETAPAPAAQRPATTAPPTTASGTPSTTTPPATAPATTASPAPPTTRPPAPATTAAPSPQPGAAAMLGRLAVAPEGTDAGYGRELFPHWIDADGDGCDTRCEVLAAERLPGGSWRSLYDGVTTRDPGDLDIDHVVALAEAWRSGASTWSTERREAYANDLADPGALIAVTAASNRSKGDDDPAAWRPPDRAAWCTFATDWVTTKVRWGLTADTAEVRALQSMLTGC